MPFSDLNLIAANRLSQIPILEKLPPRAVAIILLLVLVNLLVWAAVGIVLVSAPA